MAAHAHLGDYHDDTCEARGYACCEGRIPAPASCLVRGENPIVLWPTEADPRNILQRFVARMREAAGSR